jgi:hypothetical protein
MFNKIRFGGKTKLYILLVITHKMYTKNIFFSIFKIELFF